MSVFGIADSDIANQAIDMLGHPNTIGDLQEGSREASIALRHYAPTVQEITRGANWNFARKQALMTLLQDASGSTTQQQMSQGLPVTVGTGTAGMGLWIYEYAWPVDCLRARYVPGTLQTGPLPPPGNISLPPNPIMSGLNQTRSGIVRPAPFQVTQDDIPNFIGAITNWNQYPDLNGTQGQSLSRQTVILTNQRYASLVYTAQVAEPNLWDPLFRQAVVAKLAAKLAMPILSPKDPKLALSMRGQAITEAKAALEAARVMDGNEASGAVDHTPDWLRTRNSYGRGGYGGGDLGGGYLYQGWLASPFPDGTIF